jgi:hypothetical protein
MVKKAFVGVVTVLVVFFGYVLTRPTHFNYAGSATFQAKPDKIFPYLVNFKKGVEWVPYMKKDPNIKIGFGGTDGEVGSTMTFDANAEVGTGQLEVIKAVPNESVDLKLTMTKPFQGESFVHYTLEDDNGATKFTWSLEGENGFFGKLISVFIDMEKMMAGDFQKGFENLRPLVEQI